MDDLEKYITKRKKRSAVFAQDFDACYGEFKIGIVLRQAREQAGMTQEELAQKLQTIVFLDRRRIGQMHPITIFLL